jgi:hypothetical protein
MNFEAKICEASDNNQRVSVSYRTAQTSHICCRRRGKKPFGISCLRRTWTCETRTSRLP